MRLFGLEVRWAAAPPTRFLGDLVKVDLSPSDVCVLMCRDTMTPDSAARIQSYWLAAVGPDVTLIVLEAGMKLGVLSPPKAVEIHEKLKDEAAVAEAVSG